jgi:hypothetical protein
MATLQGPKPAWQLRVYSWFSLLGWVLIASFFHHRAVRAGPHRYRLLGRECQGR